VLIAKLQEKVWPLGFHIALGGGVLNHGYSDSDLDLYVMPIFSRIPHNFDFLRVRLTEILGDGHSIPGSERYPETIFRDQLLFTPEGKRVDVFVVNTFEDLNLTTDLEL
jgi:hypothetical protein